jgi:hypothetical protein
MKIHWSLSCFAALGVNLLVASCVAGVFVRFPHRVPFNEAEFAPYNAPGTGRVVGVMSATDEGQTYLAGGSPVTLLPATSYTQEMVDRETGDGVTLLPSDPRLKKYLHLTRTDSSGNFSFQGIPTGEYFVAGEVAWDAGADEILHQWACERIKVGKGQTVHVQVTHNPQHGNSPVNNIFTLE